MPSGELAALELEARSALDSGRGQDSETILEGILRLEPDHLFALKSLSGIARARRDFPAALDLCDRAIEAHPEDVWLSFDKAQILRDQSRFDEACDIYRDVLRQRPNFGHAYIGLGQVARQRGELQEALAYFRRALDEAPDDPWRRLDVAECLCALQRFDEAGAVLAGLAQDQPDFHQAKRVLGLVALGQGRFDVAAAQFEEVLRHDPDDLWNLNDLARALNLCGRSREAQSRYRSILDQDPRFAPAVVGLCHICLDLQEDDGAAALLAQALDLDPDDPNIRFEMALACVRLGRAGQGANIFHRLSLSPEQEAWLKPRFVDALRRQAQKARAAGDFAGAAAAARELAQIDPQDVEIRLERAQDLANAREIDAACLAFRALLGDPVHGLRAAFALFELLRAAGAWDKAPEGFIEALKIHPRDAGLLMRQAILCRETGQFGAAERFSDAALAAGADPYGVLLERAHSARARHDAGAAEALLRQALEHDPRQPTAYFELTRLLTASARRQEARAVLRRLLSASPGHVEALLRLAELEQADGGAAEAESLLQSILAAFPTHVDALLALAALRESQGRRQEAEALHVQAQAAAPDDMRVVEGAARRALEAGDLEAGLAGYRHATRVDPSVLWPHVVVARLTALIEDEDAGVGLFCTLIERIGQDPDVFYAFADLLIQLGRLDDAEAVCRDARAAHPRHAAIWRQAAELHLARGQYGAVDDLLDSPPDHAESDWIAGRLALARFDHAAAASLLRKALERREGDSATLTTLAHLALLAFDFRTAEADLKRLEGLTGRRASLTHHGQLYDEFRIGGAVAEVLREALAQPAQGRIEALWSIALGEPDYTPASLALLIELRRQGLMAPPPEGYCPIPYTVAILCEPASPAAAERRAADWRAALPQANVQTFDLEAAWSAIKASGRPDLVAAFRSAPEPAIRADLFRLFQLLSRGGIVADVGVRPQSAFQELLRRGSQMIAPQDAFGAVGKGLIASVPSHWLIERALDDAIAAVNRGDHEMAWLCSGPGLITRTLAAGVSENRSSWTEIFSTLHVASPEQMGPALAFDCWVSRSK
jgi:tetratricopeptide (TPR) repeat protein